MSAAWYQRYMHWLQLFRSYRELWVIVIAGLISIGCIDILNVQSFEKEQQYRQRILAQQLHAQFESLLQEHLTALMSLNVVYQNFVEISHYDFQQYGASINSNLKGFRHLFFVDPRLNIQRVYPLTSISQGFIHIPLKNQKEVFPYFQKATNQHQPILTPFIGFLGQPKTILAIIPIFRHQHEFIGYAVGDLSLENLWDNSGKAAQINHYQVQLLDAKRTSLFGGVGSHRKLTQETFKIGNTQWTIQVWPIQSQFQVLFWQRFGIWGSGFLMMFLISLLVTGSKQHKTDLADAQKQFELIFQASPDGMLLLDDKLHFQLTNPTIQNWSNLSSSTLKEKTFFDLFTCQCPNLSKCRELSHLLCTSEEFQGDIPDILETVIADPNTESFRTLRLNASRFEGSRSSDVKSGFICVLGDISPLKELEKVRETHIATLTHDLKTPLLAQQMVLDSLLSGSVGDVSNSQQKLLNGASQSINDLIEMVNSTLLFYKLESSALHLLKHLSSLTGVVKDVMETLQPLAQSREITLELETGLEIPEIWMDPIQLKRVFHNVLSNAISYSKKESPVLVSIHNEGSDRVLVRINNQGKGITPEDLPKVFDKYYSLSRKFKQIGTGLGLYISRRIVELHGGKIWAESTPEVGTSFFISLPCSQTV